MKPMALVAAFALLGLMSTGAPAADAPTAPYNEAVKIVNGKRLVEVAPFPSHMQPFVGNFKKPEEFPYEVSVASIETPQGLMDCEGTLWYHPKACSPSTFGKALRDRRWVVKISGHWFVCGSFASAKTCVPVIVDGHLRPIPSTRE